MDLLLNNELWRHITPPQQAHAPEAEFTQGVPFQRTFPEAHNMWHGPRHEAVETMHPTHHGLSAPASQSSFVYERAGPSMDRDMAYSLPQQRLNELPPGRPFPSAEANVQSMPTALSNIAHPRPKRFVEEHGVPLVPPDVHPAVGPAPPNFITPWNVQHMRSREGVLPTPSDHGKPYQRRSSGDTPGNASHAWVHSQIRPRTGRSNSEDYVQEQDDSIPSDNDNAEEIDSTPSTLMSSNDSEAKKLLDKRRRRRESHNAVERRRRDNINSQITERTFDPGALTQSLRCYRKPCYSMQLRTSSSLTRQDLDTRRQQRIVDVWARDGGQGGTQSYWSRLLAYHWQRGPGPGPGTEPKPGHSQGVVPEYALVYQFCIRIVTCGRKQPCTGCSASEAQQGHYFAKKRRVCAPTPAIPGYADAPQPHA